MNRLVSFFVPSVVCPPRPSRVLGIVLCALLMILAPACKDNAYAKVSVLTAPGNQATEVTQFRVFVNNGSLTDELLYPKQPSKTFTIDDSQPVTFSVEFESSLGGNTLIEVEPLDSLGAPLGYGQESTTIKKGGVVDVAVLIFLGLRRPQPSPDAGVDSGLGLRPPEPGPDAASADDGLNLPSCDPYAPNTVCGPDRTCGLVCQQNSPAASMCYASGSGKPGAVCATNNDCAPGSQCFTFTALGCSVMTCLRFCNYDESTCGETGAFCNVPINCGTTPPYQACSRPCDPTGIGSTGCAPGLACFVYVDETTDCACPGLGAAGAPCTQNSGCNGEPGCSGCAAGTSCIVPTQAGAGSGNGTCRPVCNLASPSCPTGMICHPFDKSTRRLYGFCE